VAVTLFAAFIVTTHVGLVPVQAPDQPAKTVWKSGLAVSVTEVPGAKPALQTEPQVMPDGLLLTGPALLPALLTVST
jgi:hypothetical protein